MSALLTKIVSLALVVLVAGCSGVIGSDVSAAPGTPGSTTGVAASPTPAADSSADQLAPGQYRPVVFEQPGRYEFAIASQYETEPGTIGFDVRSTALSNTEIVVDLRFAGGSHQTTVSGNRIEVNDGLMTLVSGVAAIDADLRLYETVFEPGAWTMGRTLDVGAEWGVTIDGVAGEDAVDSTLTVTGTNTIGGIQCYVVKGVADVDGRTIYEGCFSPGHGFPMQSIYYDASGQVASSLVLQSYESD